MQTALTKLGLRKGKRAFCPQRRGGGLPDWGAAGNLILARPPVFVYKLVDWMESAVIFTLATFSVSPVSLLLSTPSSSNSFQIPFQTGRCGDTKGYVRDNNLIHIHTICKHLRLCIAFLQSAFEAWIEHKDLALETLTKTSSQALQKLCYVNRKLKPLFPKAKEKF